MNIKEKIMQQEVELAKIVAIETIRENLDMKVGQVIKDLEDLDTDRYHTAMVGLTFREILDSLGAESSTPVTATEATAAPKEQAPKPEPSKTKAKSERPVKKARSKTLGRTVKKAPPRAANGKAAKTQRNATVDLDNAVMEALKNYEKASMNEIKDDVGGSPAQVRASLNRLIESGLASFEGKTRSTRYFLA
jgi:heme-binding NEAT domain protein